MGTLITVGQEFPLFQNGTKDMYGLDGGIFEALEDGDGYMYSLYLMNPIQEEILAVRTKTISVRVIQEDNFVLPLIRFGNTLMIFEMSFDPTLYKDARAFQFKDANNLLSIVLIDSSNGKVNALRQANLPLKLIQLCSEKWANAFLELDYSRKYKEWYHKLQSIPLEVLWDRALYLGKMGESYNLDEIHYKLNSDHYNK